MHHLHVDPHPVLDLVAFVTTFPEPLGTMTSTGQYRIRAYRLEGSHVNHVDSDLELTEDNRLIWGFEHPRAGLIRYTEQLNEAGQWHAVGKYSRDEGQTWVQFFEMTLDRKE